MITYTVNFKPNTLSQFSLPETIRSEPNGEPNTDDYYCETERDAQFLERALDNDDAVVAYKRLDYSE